MIFLDTNVVSETLKRTPDPAVTSWLGRFDVELALSTVAIAEVAYGIEKFGLISARNDWSGGLPRSVGISRTGSTPSQSRPRSFMAC